MDRSWEKRTECNKPHSKDDEENKIDQFGNKVVKTKMNTDMGGLVEYSCDNVWLDTKEKWLLVMKWVAFGGGIMGMIEDFADFWSK